jgi:hypothetical protein
MGGPTVAAEVDVREENEELGPWIRLPGGGLELEVRD